MIIVTDFKAVAAQLDDAGLPVHEAAQLIAFKSRGKIFVTPGGELHKHYQAYKGADVEHVALTFRDLKKVVIWLNEWAGSKGKQLNMRAVS